MKPANKQGTTFDNIDYNQSPLGAGEYEQCAFNNCDLSNADLSGIFFMECTFSGCNLSMATLTKTTLRDIKFTGCKMLGLHFEACNQFGFTIQIDNCTLDHSSFYQAKLKNIVFRNARLLETDFTGCDLTGALFDNCDLSGAIFENTNIEKADFRTSFNYIIDPTKNRIKKAHFSYPGLLGLLAKYDIEIEGFE